MTDPEHPTEKYCQDRLDFHTTGARWYRDHRHLRMAEWAEEEARKWQEKLELLYPEGKGVRCVAQLP